MDDELLKLECLRHAHAEGLREGEALKRGQEIFDWTKGRGQGNGLKGRALSPLTDEEVRKIYGPIAQNEHVKVQGRVEDGIPKPFTDYLKNDPDKGAD